MAANTNATSERYEKAKACVSKATGYFPDVPTIGAKEVMQLQQDGEKHVILVDVRTEEEMAVSILKGAVTREDFEKSRLGEAARESTKLKVNASAKKEGDDVDGEVIIPYCTAGYRSGQYAKKLIGLGYPSVRNSEGVVMWTHDVGTGLVLARAPNSTVEESAAGEEQQEKQASSSPGIAASNGGAASGAGGETPVEVKRIHVYATPWDLAQEDYETVKFSTGGCLSSTFKSVLSKIFRW